MRESSIGDDNRTAVTISGLLGALRFAVPFLGGLIALVAIPALLSVWFDLDFDSTLWIIVGLVLALLTLIRPWWFWYHRKALLVRSILTDRGAIVAYLSIALVAVLAGIWRESAVASARRNCTTALANAKTSHERFQVLYREGASNLPHAGRVPKSITCERLLEPK